MGPSRSNSTITETRVEEFTPQSRSTNIDDVDDSSSALPATIQWILDKLIAPCFVDDEPFSMFIRKVAILTYATMASAGWMLIVFFVVVAETTERPSDIDKYDSLRINMVCMGFYMMIWYVGLNYTYLRRTKTCPTWLADIASCGAILGMASFSIATLQADTRVLLMSTLLLTAMCSSPRFVLLALGHAAVYVFHYLRQNFRSEIPALQFPWDHDPVTVWEKVLVFVVLSIVPSLGAVIGMYVIVTNYIQRSQQAQVASRMTIEIAQQLERYDCEEVARVMSENRKAVEPRLYAALNAVRENLESYRPHIPQYLIDSAIERAEENTMLNVGDEEHSVDDGNGSEYSEGDLRSALSSTTDPLSWGSNSFKARGSVLLHHSSSSAVLAPAALRNCRSSLKSNTGSSGTYGSFQGGRTEVSITSMLVRVFDEKWIGKMNLQQLNEAVEAINILAKTYSASVHHMDCGVVWCTWNATKRLGNHETRACHFAIEVKRRLRAEFPSLPPVAISIVTTKSTVLFVGLSQKLFVTLQQELHYAKELLARATKHDTIFVERHLTTAGESQFYFAGVEVDEKFRIIYELVDTKTKSEADEWMYEIQNANDTQVREYEKVTYLAHELREQLHHNNEAQKRLFPIISPPMAAVESHSTAATIGTTQQPTIGSGANSASSPLVPTAHVFDMSILSETAKSLKDDGCSGGYSTPETKSCKDHTGGATTETLVGSQATIDTRPLNELTHEEIFSSLPENIRQRTTVQALKTALAATNQNKTN